MKPLTAHQRMLWGQLLRGERVSLFPPDVGVLKSLASDGLDLSGLPDDTGALPATLRDLAIDNPRAMARKLVTYLASRRAHLEALIERAIKEGDEGDLRNLVSSALLGLSALDSGIAMQPPAPPVAEGEPEALAVQPGANYDETRDAKIADALVRHATEPRSVTLRRQRDLHRKILKDGTDGP